MRRLQQLMTNLHWLRSFSQVKSNKAVHSNVFTSYTQNKCCLYSNMQCYISNQTVASLIYLVALRAEHVAAYLFYL